LSDTNRLEIKSKELVRRNIDIFRWEYKQQILQEIENRMRSKSSIAREEKIPTFSNQRIKHISGKSFNKPVDVVLVLVTASSINNNVVLSGFLIGTLWKKL
jgi:hypothetical protein